MATQIEIECFKALSTARMFIKQKGPYFSTIVYSFIPRFAPGLGTLGLSKGLVLTIDPQWYVDMEKEVDPAIQGHALLEAADAMRAGVLVHEVGHHLRGMERIERLVRAGADHRLVNKAFDLPINHDMEKAGWVLPAWALYPRTYGFPEGLTGEQYYELLLQNPDKAKGGKSGKEEGDGEGSGKPQSGDGDQVGAGRCGGCAGNPADKTLEGVLDKEVGRSPADVERIRKETVRSIQEAVANGCGNVPGSFVEELNAEKVKSLVPWARQLQSILMRTSGRVMCGQSEFSMRRPSRRSFTRGVIRPSMIERKPEFAFIEDGSGSMGKEQILASRSEIIGCCKKLGISSAWFVNADTKFSSKPVRVSVNDIMKLPLSGRGGTDFRAPLAAIQKLSPKPNICIYTTDGDGQAPDRAPKGMEVVWCIVPTPYGVRPAKWGKLIVVSDDQKLRDPYGV